MRDDVVTYGFTVQLECALCLRTEEYDKFCAARVCGHIFHTICFLQYAKAVRKQRGLACPCCRTRICSSTSDRNRDDESVLSSLVRQLVLNDLRVRPVADHGSQTERELREIHALSSQPDDMVGISMMVNIADAEGDQEYDSGATEDEEAPPPSPRQLQRRIMADAAAHRAAIANLTQQRDEARDLVGKELELQSTIAQLRIELETTKNDRYELLMEKEGLVGDHNDIHKRLEETETELRRRVTELQRIRDRNDSMSDEKRMLERKTADYRQRVREHEANTADQKRQRDQEEARWKSEIARLKEEAETAETKHYEAESVLQNQLAAARESLARKDEVMARVVASRDDARQELRRMRASCVCADQPPSDTLAPPMPERAEAGQDEATIQGGFATAEAAETAILPPSRTIWKPRQEQRSASEIKGDSILKNLGYDKNGATLAHGEISKPKKRKVR